MSAWDDIADRTRLVGDRFAVVLLSGGMDSTACLYLAAECYPRDRIAAIVVDYGQPHAQCEIPIAQREAARLGIRVERLCIADAMRAMRAAERMANAPHGQTGAHPATVPARNLVLTSLACAHGCAWSTLPVDVWIGACADDVGGFVDCHPDFFAQTTIALTYGAGRSARVVAPLLRTTKRALIEAARARPDALAAIRRSWSCYRGGDVPCGECTPCVLRADAFDAAGITDAPETIEPFGGDPAREIGRH